MRLVEAGIYLGNYGPPATLDSMRLLALAAAADRYGLDSVWAADHVVIPDHIESVYPTASRARRFEPDDTEQAFEPVVTLGYLAARFERLRVGTSILVLPQRNPLLVAKQIACVDALSGGRISSVGVGVGWLREEFEILGADFDHRWSVFEEYVEILKLAWTERKVAYQGQHYRFPATRVEPKPTSPGGPSLTIGGHTERALRIAGRLADGWNVFAVAPSELREGLDKIREHARSAGRDLEPAAVVRLVWPDSEAPPTPSLPWVLVGSDAQVGERLRSYSDAGASDLVVALPEPWAVSRCAEVIDRLGGILPGIR